MPVGSRPTDNTLRLTVPCVQTAMGVTLPGVFRGFPALWTYTTGRAATAALVQAYHTARAQVGPEAGVDRLLTAIHPMIPVINRFFDDVLVMHEDQALRESRLGLLQDIWDLSRGIVDVTRLEGF